MDLGKYLSQTECGCILDNSLFFSVVNNSGETLSNEITCRDAFFFLLVLDGKAKIQLHGSPDEFYDVEKDDLIVIPASAAVDFQYVQGGYTMYSLMLTPSFFYSLSSSQYLYGKLCEFIMNNTLHPLRLQDEASDYLRRTMELFRGHSDRKIPHKEGIYSHLCNFLMLHIGDLFFFSIEKSAPFISNRNSVCHKFKSLLFEHYRQQHKIHFYAERLSISTIYLSRIIREETGQTVYNHITGLLYSDAKKLLSCSKYDIQNIAYMLGFADQASFSRFFKRFAGMSPKDYRNHVK